MGDAAVTMTRRGFIGRALAAIGALALPGSVVSAAKETAPTSAAEWDHVAKDTAPAYEWWTRQQFPPLPEGDRVYLYHEVQRQLREQLALAQDREFLQMLNGDSDIDDPVGILEA